MPPRPNSYSEGIPSRARSRITILASAWRSQSEKKEEEEAAAEGIKSYGNARNGRIELPISLDSRADREETFQLNRKVSRTIQRDSFAGCLDVARAKTARRRGKRANERCLFGNFRFTDIEPPWIVDPRGWSLVIRSSSGLTLSSRSTWYSLTPEPFHQITGLPEQTGERRDWLLGRYRNRRAVKAELSRRFMKQQCERYFSSINRKNTICY